MLDLSSNRVRLTATKYLDTLVADGFLKMRRIGCTNYYVNIALNTMLTGEVMTDGAPPPMRAP